MASENSSTRVQAPAHIPEYSSSQSQSSETHDGVVLNPSGRINLDGEDLCSHGATSSRVVEDILDPAVLCSTGGNPSHINIGNNSNDSNNFNGASSDINNLLNDLGDGSRCDIKKCSNKRCKMRNYLSCHDKVVSSSTHRLYDCIVPPGNNSLNCHSPNVVYLLTCSNCKLQYVGETALKISERFNWHRSCFKYPAHYGFCNRLSNHFSEGLCKNANYSVQIIEKLEGDGRTERNALNSQVTSLRKARETHWMLKLRTVYPFGLNDRIGDEHRNTTGVSMIACRFPPLKRSAPTRGLTRRRPTNMVFSFDADDLHDRFKITLADNLPNAMNFIRITLSSMKKSCLRKLHTLFNDELSSKADDFKFAQWYNAAIDIIESKLYKPIPPKKRRPPPENTCSVFFHNKAVELINLSHIFHEPDVLKSHPSIADKFPIPSVIYSLTPPIAGKIFNFNKFVAELDIEAFRDNMDIVPCSCQDSSYKHKDLGHILTGDLSIVENNSLRKILSKGPKYREPKPLNFGKAREHIVTGLDNCISKWCNKKGLPIDILKDWKYAVLEKVDNRIKSLSSNLKYHKVNVSLSNEEVKSCLSELQSKYVITPIDKANGNIAFICKRYYALTIVKELGLDSDTGSPTYSKESVKTPGDIVDQQVNDLKNCFNLNVDEEQRELPHIYWLPKLHKSPPKARFIIAAPNNALKPLSKALTAILKLFFHQIESYHKKCQYFSGINSFWVIESNKPVIDCLKKLSSRKKAKSLSTFDFSTLYTKIPHDKLLAVLNELVDFCFSGGIKKFVKVHSGRAFWTDVHHERQITFSKDSIKQALHYLMNNCFFSAGNLLFRQAIGIPMGSDPAPFMANLFLFYYEDKFMKSLKFSNIARARRFSYIYRFIDDLNSINDYGEFERCYKDIYPPELELGKENLDSSRASFLDLDIKVEDRVFVYNQYDKRDAFPFSIVRLPFVCSNMPSKIFYSSISAEILRIGRTSSSAADFVSRSRVILDRMSKQGSDKARVLKSLVKMFNNHTNDLLHIAGQSNAFVGLIL